MPRHLPNVEFFCEGERKGIAMLLAYANSLAIVALRILTMN